MNLRPNQLAAHLERGLAPVYAIHGDEPLLAIEAGDAIRAAARKAGCEEREVQVAERGFDWDAFRAANANLGLFGTRKLLDLRIPSGKPGVEGAAALEACVWENRIRGDESLEATVRDLRKRAHDVNNALSTALLVMGAAGLEALARHHSTLRAWLVLPEPDAPGRCRILSRGSTPSDGNPTDTTLKP